MSNNTMSNFNINTLPDEIIREISTYIKCINYRNGKYIYKISENDPRYEILKTIKLPIHNFKSGFYSILRLHKIHLDRFDLNIFYYFNDFTKNTKIHIEKYKNGILRGTYIKRVSSKEYLIDENGICIKLND